MEYIERIKAMNICRGYSEHCFETNDSRGQDIADRIEDDIVALPTADVVEVKHGEWIDTGSFDHHKTPIYGCPVCRREVADNYINLHKYCLHCGAKMDGGKADDK